jgi:hypothetical protein
VGVRQDKELKVSLKYSNPQESKGDDKDNQVASEKL